MELPPPSQPPAARNAPPTAFAESGGQSGSAAAIGSDFETFLQMLTVQMENQDPLNPSDPTDFATQLATFSSVEQQVKTNELLVALGTQMGALAVSQLSGWVGMDARVEIPVRFDGEPVTLFAKGNTHADRAELVVRDSIGNVVQRRAIDTGPHEIDWTGISDSGETLSGGDYDLSVEYFAQDERLSTEPVQFQARIVEARNEEGVPFLVLDTGQEVESSQIIGLRAPQ